MPYVKVERPMIMLQAIFVLSGTSIQNVLLSLLALVATLRRESLLVATNSPRIESESSRARKLCQCLKSITAADL